MTIYLLDGQNKWFKTILRIFSLLLFEISFTTSIATDNLYNNIDNHSEIECHCYELRREYPPAPPPSPADDSENEEEQHLNATTPMPPVNSMNNHPTNTSNTNSNSS